MEMENKYLLKQTYEFSYYLAQILLMGLMTPLYAVLFALAEIKSAAVVWLVILPVFIVGTVVYYGYRIYSLFKLPELYVRYDAKVKAIHRSYGRRWYLTLSITKEDGTVFEADTSALFSVFKAKIVLDGKISVLYDPVDGRLAVIKTDI